MTNILKKAYNWFTTSSQNPNDWSLRSKAVVTGLVGLLVSYLATKGIGIPEAQVQYLIGHVTEILSAMAFVVGLVRAVATPVDEKINE